MKRIQLFEFEDFAWFPQWLRRCITRLILVMHDLLGTSENISELIAEGLQKSNSSVILDLCSGSGGPMPKVLQILQNKYDRKDINLTLTDLYPDIKTDKAFNRYNGNNITYLTTPVDATAIESIDKPMNSFRTMIGSFHHFSPQEAKKILASAQESKEPILIFEISDNSLPIGLWWIAIPINFLMTFFITPMVRPMSWQQLVFTYFIPIIPFIFAWDGAVSNARTYTLEDLDKILSSIESNNYHWEKGTIQGKTKQLYLLGIPA